MLQILNTHIPKSKLVGFSLRFELQMTALILVLLIKTTDLSNNPIFCSVLSKDRPQMLRVDPAGSTKTKTKQDRHFCEIMQQ